MFNPLGFAVWLGFPYRPLLAKKWASFFLSRVYYLVPQNPYFNWSKPRNIRPLAPKAKTRTPELRGEHGYRDMDERGFRVWVRV